MGRSCVEAVCRSSPGSATRASLTDPSTPDGGVLKNGFFRRVVPHDNFQAGTDVTFMRQRLNVGSGDTVMVVDSGRGVLGAARQPCGSAASSGQYRGRPPVSAGGADRLHVARQQGCRSASGGGLLRVAGRLERAAVLPAAEVTGLPGRVLRHGRHVQLDRLQGAGCVHLVVQPRHQRRADRAAVRRRSSRLASATRSRSALRRSSPCRRSRWASPPPARTAGSAAPRFAARSARSGWRPRSSVRRSGSRTPGTSSGGVGFSIFQIGNDGTYNAVQKG